MVLDFFQLLPSVDLSCSPNLPSSHVSVLYTGLSVHPSTCPACLSIDYTIHPGISLLLVHLCICLSIRPFLCPFIRPLMLNCLIQSLWNVTILRILHTSYPHTQTYTQARTHKLTHTQSHTVRPRDTHPHIHSVS